MISLTSRPQANKSSLIIQSLQTSSPSQLEATGISLLLKNSRIVKFMSVSSTDNVQDFCEALPISVTCT